jgi:hypothetical protein
MLVQQELAPQYNSNNVVTNAAGVVSTNFYDATIPVQMAPDLQIPITVQGIRVSDNYATFNTVSNSVPYSWTTYSITNFATF